MIKVTQLISVPMGDCSATAAKLLLQSCQTLCDPIDGRLPRPWDSPGKNTGVGCQFPWETRAQHFILRQDTQDPGDTASVWSFGPQTSSLGSAPHPPTLSHFRRSGSSLLYILLLVTIFFSCIWLSTMGDTDMGQRVLVLKGDG